MLLYIYLTPIDRWGLHPQPPALIFPWTKTHQGHEYEDECDHADDDARNHAVVRLLGSLGLLRNLVVLVLGAGCEHHQASVARYR
jgi:hypothetical protein